MGKHALHTERKIPNPCENGRRDCRWDVGEVWKKNSPFKRGKQERSGQRQALLGGANTATDKDPREEQGRGEGTGFQSKVREEVLAPTSSGDGKVGTESNTPIPSAHSESILFLYLPYNIYF